MTPEQELLKKLALSQKNDVPILTNDPVVNHAVDCHMEDQHIPYDETLYKDEIEAWRRSGGLRLGWVKD